MNDACKPKKNKIGPRAKYKCFPQVLFLGVRDFTTYFHFRGVAFATFDRNFIHSADAFFLVMAHASFFYQKSRAQHTGSENRS